MWTCCRNHTRTHKHTRVHLNTRLHSDTHTISHTHNHVSQQKHCPTSRLSFSHQPCYSREPAFPTFCSFVFFFGRGKDIRRIKRLSCNSVFPLHVGLEKLRGEMLALQNAPVWRDRTESQTYVHSLTFDWPEWIPAERTQTS